MAFSPAARAWRDGGGDPAARLLLLRADPVDTLDRESGPATFLGDCTEPDQLLVSKAASRRQQEQRSQPVAGPFAGETGD